MLSILGSSELHNPNLNTRWQCFFFKENGLRCIHLQLLKGNVCAVVFKFLLLILSPLLFETSQVDISNTNETSLAD